MLSLLAMVALTRNWVRLAGVSAALYKFLLRNEEDLGRSDFVPIIPNELINLLMKAVMKKTWHASLVCIGQIECIRGPELVTNKKSGSILSQRAEKFEKAFLTSNRPLREFMVLLTMIAFLHHGESNESRKDTEVNV